MDRRELIRKEILTQCYGFRPAARDAERMARSARAEGEIDATAAEFSLEADYLEMKGFIVGVRDAIAQAHKRYKITAAGIDYAEAQVLA
jgi:hypothetical protein